VSVTSAFGTTAPVLSRTVPVIEPVPCANNAGTDKNNSTNAMRGKNLMVTFPPSFVVLLNRVGAGGVRIP